MSEQQVTQQGNNQGQNPETVEPSNGGMTHAEVRKNFYDRVVEPLEEKPPLEDFERILQTPNGRKAAYQKIKELSEAQGKPVGTYDQFERIIGYGGQPESQNNQQQQPANPGDQAPDQAVDQEGRDFEKKQALVEAKRIKKEVFGNKMDELRSTHDPQGSHYLAKNKSSTQQAEELKQKANRAAEAAAEEYLEQSGIDVTELSTEEVGDLFYNLSNVEDSADRRGDKVQEDLENDYWLEGLFADREDPTSRDGKFKMNDFKKTYSKGFLSSLSPGLAGFSSSSIFEDKVYLSPEEIMSASVVEEGKIQYEDSETGEVVKKDIPGFEKEDLLSAKDYIGLSSTIKRTAKSSALSKRSSLLNGAMDATLNQMSDEDLEKLNNAIEVSNQAPSQEDIENLSTEERAKINQSVETFRELDQKYPGVLDKMNKIQSAYQEVSEEFEQLERKEQNGLLVEKLEKEVEQEASETYADRNWFTNRMANLYRFVQESPSRFINETTATGEAVLAIAGSEMAQDRMVAGAYSKSTDYAPRSYQEKAAGVRQVSYYNGKKVVVDGDGNIEEVLDRDTDIPTKDPNIRNADGSINNEWRESFHSNPVSKVTHTDYNNASIMNQIQVTGSEMTGIIALGMATGGVGSGARALVGKAAKNKIKRGIIKTGTKGIAKANLGARAAELIGSVGMFSGRSARDAVKAGFDFDEAGKIGLTKGTAEGLVAAIIPTVGKAGQNISRGLVGKNSRVKDILKAAGEAGSKVDKQAMKNLLNVIAKGKSKRSYKEAFKSLSKDIGGEVIEENAMNVIEPMINRGYNNIFTGHFEDESIFDLTMDQIVETSLVAAGASFLPGSISALSQSRQGLDSEYLSETMKAVVKNPQLFSEYLDDAKETGFVSEQEYQDMSSIMSSVEQERDNVLKVEGMSKKKAEEYSVSLFREKAATMAAQVAEADNTGNNKRFADMADLARIERESILREVQAEESRRKDEPHQGPMVNVSPPKGAEPSEESSDDQEQQDGVELSEGRAQEIAYKIQNDPSSLTDADRAAYEANRTQVEKYVDSENVAFESEMADPDKSKKDAIIKSEDPSKVDEVVYESVDGKSRVVTKDGQEMVQVQTSEGNWKYHPYQSSPRAKQVRNELAGRPTRQEARQEFDQQRSPRRTPETSLSDNSTVAEAMVNTTTQGAQGQAMVTDKATQNRGVLGINHQRGTFEFKYEDENGDTKVKSLGKVSEQKDKTLKDLGFATDKKVEPLGDNRYRVDGKEYINEQGQDAVSETRTGNRKVTLTDPDTGKPRRFFTPKVVEDLAYQIYLEEAASESDAFEDFFQRKIEEYERSVRSNQEQGPAQEDGTATEGATNTNVQGVSEQGQESGQDSDSKGKRDIKRIFESFFGERKDDSETFSSTEGNLNVTDAADNKLQRQILKHLEKALKFISKSMPEMQVVVHKSRESYELAVFNANSNATEADARMSAGFHSGNAIHINLKSPRLKKNTLFHEILHPVFQMIKANNKDLYMQLVEEVRDAILSNNAVSSYFSKFLENYKERIPQNAIPEQKARIQARAESIMEEEMLVEFVSKIATGELDTTKEQETQVKKSLRSFLKKAFGYNNPDAVRLTDGSLGGMLRMIAQTLNDGVELEMGESKAEVAEFDPAENYDSGSEIGQATSRQFYDSPLEAMNDASIDSDSVSSSARTFNTDAGRYLVAKVGQYLLPFYSDGTKFVPFAGYTQDGKMIPFVDNSGELMVNSSKIDHATKLINAAFSPNTDSVADSETNMEDFQSALAQSAPTMRQDPAEMTEEQLTEALQGQAEVYSEQPEIRFQLDATDSIDPTAGNVQLDEGQFGLDTNDIRFQKSEAKEVKDSPNGTFLNIEMIAGKAGEELSQNDILNNLPVDPVNVEVFDKTLAIQLSRPLSDSEMMDLMISTEQDAIPQVSNNEGVLHGQSKKQLDDYGGEFLAKYFIFPKNIKNESKVKAGNRLFNEPVQEVKEIADRYYERVFGKERPIFEGVRKLDKDLAKRISDAFEAMEDNPSDPEVQKAYSAMAEETLEQYKDFENAGYVIEINNEEPYPNAQSMMDDVRGNKRMKIFSTESGFGDTPITEKQRKENPLLQDSGIRDKNGQKLLVNDVFRAIHDFYGHSELGNGFGPIGEENAWNVHARMYTPLARRAMTTETRGQNSYVNFSGINDEAFKLRDKARRLRKEGKLEEARSLVDKVYEIMKFADQKIGLLPEEFSEPEIRFQKSPEINTEGTLQKVYISAVGEDTTASDRKINASYNQRGQATMLKIPKDQILDLSEYNEEYRKATGSDILAGAIFRIDSEDIESSYEYALKEYARAVGQDKADVLKEKMSNASFISAPDPLSPSDTDYWVRSMSGIQPTRVDVVRTPMDRVSESLDVRTDEGGDFIAGEQFKLYLSNFNAPITMNEKPNWIRLDNVQIQEDFDIDEEVVEKLRDLKLAMDDSSGSIVFSNTVMNKMAESVEEEALLEMILEDEGFVSTKYGYLRGPGNKIPTDRFIYMDLEFVKLPNGAYATLSGQSIDPEGDVQSRVEYERWSEGFPTIDSNDIPFKAKTGQSSVFKLFHGTLGEFYEFDSVRNSRNSEISFLGNVNYFTSSEYDASVNYGRSDAADNQYVASEMADRLVFDVVKQVDGAVIDSPQAYRTLADTLESLSRDMVEVEQSATQTLQELGFSPYTSFKVSDAVQAYISDSLFKDGQPKTMQLFVKSENPVVLNGERISFKNYDPSDFTDQQIEEAWKEVKEDYNIESDSEKNNYIGEVYQRAFDKYDVSSDILIALNDAIDEVGFDKTAAELLGDSELYNSATVDLNEVYEKLKGYVGGNIISKFLTNLGFDSIVLQDAVSEFPSLFTELESERVSHVHVPHNHRNNIKLADGRNTTFGESADIRFQKTGTQNTEPSDSKAARKADALARIARAANSATVDKYSVNDLYNNMGEVSSQIKHLNISKEELRESLGRRDYFQAPKALKDRAKRASEIEGAVKEKLANRFRGVHSKLNDRKYKRMLRMVKKVERVFRPFLGNIEFHIARTPDDFVDQVIKLGGTASPNDKGVYIENVGFVMNFSKAQDVDVLHEGLHPVLNMVFQFRPDLMTSFYNQLEEMAKADSRIMSVIEFGEGYADKNQEGENRNQDEVMNEAIVQFFAEFISGDLDIEIPNMKDNEKSNLLDKIMNLINDIISRFVKGWDPRKQREASNLKLFAETLQNAFLKNRTVTSTMLVGEKIDPAVLASRDSKFKCT